LKRRNVHKVAAGLHRRRWALSPGFDPGFRCLAFQLGQIRLLVLLIILGFPIAPVFEWPVRAQAGRNQTNRGGRRRHMSIPTAKTWIYVIIHSRRSFDGLFFVGRYKASVREAVLPGGRKLSRKNKQRTAASCLRNHRVLPFEKSEQATRRTPFFCPRDPGRDPTRLRKIGARSKSFAQSHRAPFTRSKNLPGSRAPTRGGQRPRRQRARGRHRFTSMASSVAPPLTDV